MEKLKPRLLPLSLPWMVASVPFLKLQCDAQDGRPLSVTLVAYFRLQDTSQAAVGRSVRFAEDPGPFIASDMDQDVAYRLVRINFSGGLKAKVSDAVSDRETIREADFDWSAVPGARRPGEDAKENYLRSTQFWLDHQISPNPGVYVVDGSDWLPDLPSTPQSLKHYLVLGQDEYVEVLAEHGSWEPGQILK